MDTRQRSQFEIPCLAAILVLAAALRLWGLASFPWEQDELYTLRDATHLYITSRGAPGIGARPLYYLIQHALLQWFDPTPLALRIPAFLFGLAGVWATWWIGRATFGRVAGLLAALLTAVSPWHLYASQFARYWTLVYLFAALFYWLLPTAIESNRRSHLGALLLVMLGGTLSHPTFLFPVLGTIVAVHVVDRAGAIAIRLPTRQAIGLVWVPYLVLIGGWYTFLKITGHSEAIQNLESRGIVATIRLIPAMVQWTPLEVAAAAMAAVPLLAVAGGGHRRWAVMAVFGVASGIGALLVLSFFTGVYADYGISLLPLGVLVIGGAVERTGGHLPPQLRPVFAVGAAAVLCAAAFPGVASHMSDGSRFDFRGSYEAIRKLGPEHPVAGGIEAYHEAYAPDLRPIKRPIDSAAVAAGFWYLASFQRYGIRGVGARGQTWLDRTCRRVLVTERPRIDYRTYRVELLWCGPPPVPNGAPTGH